MKAICNFYGTTIGKKVVAAVTGLVLFLFLVGHMSGNLKAFAGAGADGVHKLDHYAHFLRAFLEDALGHGTFLWGARIVLLGALLLHIYSVVTLQILSKAARPVGYVKDKRVASTAAARTMMIGGPIITVFIILHILHFTTGSIHFQDFQHGHVYANIYAAFQNKLVVLGYVAAMLVIGLHLYHGVWSLFQTLGLDNPDRNGLLRNVARVSAIVLFFGFIAVPVAFALGAMPEPPQKFISAH